MPDQKIVEYIKSQLGLGADRNKIKNDLLLNGWLPSEIDLAFNSLNTTPPNQNSPTSEPTTATNPNLINSMPANPAPISMVQQPNSSILKKILVTVVVLILIGGISVGAYFGYNNYKNSQITLGGAVINTLEAFSTGKITSGEFSVTVDVTAKDVGQNYSDVITDTTSEQIASQLGDVAFNLIYSGVVNKITDGKFETSGNLSASVKNSNGGSLETFDPQELGLKYKVFSDNIYLNIQSIPSLASMIIPANIDITKYLNQWFSIPTAITSQYSEAYTGSIRTTTMMTDEIKSGINDLFDKSGAFSVIDQKAEKTDKGTTVTALYIKIDWDKLGDEIIKINKEISAKNNFSFSESQELEIKANMVKAKELLVSDTLLKVLVGNDGYIHSYVSSGNLVDKDSKQIGSYKIDASADNFNQSFTIDRPVDARSFTEVVTEINSSMGSHTAPSSVTTLEKQVYSNAKYGFKINAPKGWRVDESGKSGTLVFFFNNQSDKEAVNQFTANINVTSESAQGLDLDSYTKASKDTLSRLFQNYKLTEDRAVTANGVPARIIGSTFTQGLYHLRNLQLIVLKGGQAYIVTFTALESTWSKYKSLIESSLLTFKLN